MKPASGRVPIRWGIVLTLWGALALTGCRAASPAGAPAPTGTPPPRVSPAPSPSPSPFPFPTSEPTARRVAVLGLGAPQALAWSPDGTRLAVGTAAGVQLYGGEPLTAVRRLAPQAEVVALAWSPDGTRLAWGTQDGQAVLWEAEEGRERNRLQGESAAVTALAFSPSGGQLAVGRADSTLALWDFARGEVSSPLRGHTDRLTALTYCGALSPEGPPALYSAARDGTLTLWDPSAGRLVTSLRTGGAPIRALACDAASGRVYSVDAVGLLQGWGPQGQIVRYAAEAGFRPLSLGGSAQGWLALGGEGGQIALWDGQSGAPLRRIQAHTGAVLALAYRPGSGTLASLGADGALRLWNGAPQVNRDTQTPAPLETVRGFAGRVQTALLRPGLLVSAHADGALRLWWPPDGAARAVLYGHREAVTALAYDSARQVLASAGLDGVVRLWNLPSGASAGSLYTHSPLTALAFSGGYLAAAGTDGSLEVWQGETLLKSVRLPAGTWARTLAVQPPDTLWVLRSDGGMQSYQLPDLQPQPPRDGWPAGGRVLACAAQCSRMALADRSGNLWLGAPSADWARVTLPQAVSALRFSPQGDTLLAGLENGEVWLVSSGGGLQLLLRAESAVSWLGTAQGVVYVGTRSGRIELWAVP